MDEGGFGTLIQDAYFGRWDSVSDAGHSTLLSCCWLILFFVCQLGSRGATVDTRVRLAL
jgi:hypothetical protein